jgi:hypothetical protein
MNVQDFVDATVAFVRANEDWAGPVAFVVAFLESFFFLSILWPGTAILIGISALLARSGVEMAVLGPAIIWAGIGGSLGYAISYWIGLYYKDGIRDLWPFSRYPAMVDRGQFFFSEMGCAQRFLWPFFWAGPRGHPSGRRNVCRTAMAVSDRQHPFGVHMVCRRVRADVFRLVLSVALSNRLRRSDRSRAILGLPQPVLSGHDAACFAFWRITHLERITTFRAVLSSNSPAA